MLTKLKVRLIMTEEKRYMLSARAGMHPSRLSQLANGNARPSDDEARRLAEVLNCEPEDILEK